jgi:glycerate 2-kinase
MTSVDLKTAAQQIFQRALAAIEVERVVREHLQLKGDKLTAGEEEFDLARFPRILVIGIGKASVAMARGVEAVLGKRVTDGVSVTNAVLGATPARIPVLLGGHPLPNPASLEAAEKALALLEEADSPKTLAIFLISGGGSALFEKPIDESLTLEDLREVNRALVGCGAVISEMNIVRRRLSAVKGGRLAEAAPRARQLSLYISDVNRGDLASVASGPLLPDPAPRDEFQRIISRYDLLQKFPPRVAALVSSGEIPQMPAPDPSAAHLRSHHLLLDNAQALAEAQRIARQDYGLVVEIAEDLIEAEVEPMARTHLERLTALRAKHPGRTVCLLSGGEVICPVRGKGQGGRNQEFVLRAALALQPPADIAVLSAGTDGIDGNSPATGAVADATTIPRAKEAGLAPKQYLDDSDSFTFFQALGDAIITGPTGNNVRDLRILLAR